MLILSVMLSFLQVGSCADGDWGIQPKDPVDSGSPWTIAGKADDPASSDAWVVPGKGELDQQWTIQGKVDEESSSSGSSSSDSEDSDVPVAKKPPVKVDPESRRHEEHRQPAVDRTAQLKDFVSEHSEDIQLAALVCCGLIAVVLLAPFVVALLGGVSVGAVGLGALVCLCSPVIIAVACCCCCLMLLGYGHK